MNRDQLRITRSNSQSNQSANDDKLISSKSFPISMCIIYANFELEEKKKLTKIRARDYKICSQTKELQV